MAYDVVVVDERIACVSDTVREPPPSEKPEVYHRELPHGFPRLTKVRQDLPSVLNNCGCNANKPIETIVSSSAEPIRLRSFPSHEDAVRDPSLRDVAVGAYRVTGFEVEIPTLVMQGVM